MRLFKELEKAVEKALRESGSFESATPLMIDWVNSQTSTIELIKAVGTIPESIPHDSSEEKLFSKVSDAVLARAFKDLGLKSTVLKERGDAADVHAESIYHGYSLVADAKAFRLSRTAKNQKDFKVVALSNWRNDADYAVLCSPYFHYPSTRSQIYSQSLQHNVCLLSWEHLIQLIESGVKESDSNSLADVWNWPEKQAQTTSVQEAKRCFIPAFDDWLADRFSFSRSQLKEAFSQRIEELKERGVAETEFWLCQRKAMLQLSREEAISELIRTKKIDEKITQIANFVEGLHYE